MVRAQHKRLSMSDYQLMDTIIKSSVDSGVGKRHCEDFSSNLGDILVSTVDLLPSCHLNGKSWPAQDQ